MLKHLDTHVIEPSVSYRRQVARLSAYALLATYIVWNFWWIGQGRLAPSLMKAVIGLPCPTTGGTRSAMALIEGDIAGSLYYNPMTMPIVLLMLVTLFSLSARAIREQPLRLPRAYLHAWGAVLLLAWIIKLLSPTASW